MRALLKTVFDGICEDFGHPVKLIRLMDEHPDIRVSLEAPAPCISAESIVPWHELGQASYQHWPRREHGSLMGYGRDEANIRTNVAYPFVSEVIVTK